VEVAKSISGPWRVSTTDVFMPGVWVYLQNGQSSSRGKVRRGVKDVFKVNADENGVGGDDGTD
jgi:hypothetical protein